MYDRGNDSNVSDLDNQYINSSENSLSSFEDFKGVEDDKAKKSQTKL